MMSSGEVNGKNAVVSCYGRQDNWMLRPESIEYPVDLFYLYPTCYTKPEASSPMICELDCASMREKARSYKDTHVAVFEGLANLYAPYYRQCDAHALGELSPADGLALFFSSPKDDVFAALDYYFAELNQGRPFIFASHSQGSVMLCIVLQDYFKAHPELLQRMVCAYAIGYGVTEQYLRDNPHLRFAQGEDDTGVVVSYNTEAPGNAGHVNSVVPSGSISINPLNWRLDETPASVKDNLGSLVRRADGAFEVGPGLANARVDRQRGVIICDNVAVADYANHHVATFGPESYHSYDYKFYFANLRDNVAKRTQRFLREQGA